MDNRILATFNAYDLDEVRRYAQSLDVQIALDDFRNWLRGHYKHGEDTISTEEVWEKFHEHMGQYLD